MTSKWQLARLGDILELQRRWFRPELEQEYVEIGVRCFGNGIFHKSPVSGFSLGNKRVLRIEPGDLILNNVFAWEGAVAVATESEAGKIGSHRFITLTPRDRQVDVRFLQYFFRTPAGLEITGKASPGSAGRNRTLGINRFLDQSITLPSLSEQRQIVAKIDQLAERIGEAKRLRETASCETELIHASACRDVFAGPNRKFATVDERIGRKALRNGKSVKEGEHPDGIRCIRLSAITGGRINTEDAKAIPLSLGQAQDYLITPGDVFVMRGNGSKDLVGRAALAESSNGRTIFPDLLIRIPLDQGIWLPEFFVAYWNSPIMRLQIEEAAKTTSGIWKINQGHVASFTLPLIPVSDQRRIIAYLDDLQAKTDALKEQQAKSSAELDALFPSILDRAFRGNL